MHRRPGSTGRPRFDIADIVRAHRDELWTKHGLGPAEGRVLSAIALCRTPALGGHLDVCRSCGHEQPAYNSCRNRHCPKCQALAQERWIASRAERLLPVRHFHVVFTLPSELRTLCRHAPRAMYDALFEVATSTLLAETRWLRARDLLGPLERASASSAAAPSDEAGLTWQEHLRALTGRDVRSCPLCGGLMDRQPLARAPPAAA